MARALENGQEFLEQDNFEKARIEFSNVLQIEPNHVEAIYLSGVAAEGLRDYRPALQAYQAALNIDANHAGSRAAVGRLYLFGGLVDEALDEVDTGLQTHPDDAELLTIRAAALSAQGQTQEAQDIAERIVDEDPANERAVALLAGLYMSNEDMDRAKTITQRALASLPENIDLRVVLSQLYLQDGEQDLAEQTLNEVIAIEPDELSHRNRLANFYIQTEHPDEAHQILEEIIVLDPDNLERKIALVNYLLAQDSFDSAEQRMLRFVAENDGDTELQLALGDFYVANSYPEDAERIYQEVADTAGLETYGLQARNRLAARMVQTQRVAEAEPLLEEVLSENPRDNDALILRASLALADGQTLDAITDLRSVLRDQPDSPLVLATLARAHVANGEPALARENYRRSIQVDPGNSNVRLEYAEFLGRRGETDEAQQVLDASLRLNEMDLPTLETQFKVQVAARDLDAAGQTVEQILSNFPEHPIGYYLTGQLAEINGETDRAIEQFRASLERAPRGVEPLSALARVLLVADRASEAKEALMSAVRDYPDHSVAHNLLAELRLSERDFSGALASANSAIASAPAWWVPYRTKALASGGRGDVDAMRRALTEGLAATNDAPALGIDLATIHIRSDEPNEAITVYEKLYDKNPSSEVIANNLAMLLATHREDPQSLDRASELTERFRASDVASYLNTYGWVRYKQGNLDEAVSYLRRAAQSSPESALMRYHLGMALLSQGNIDAARAELSSAVESEEEFDGRDAAREALAGLPDA